MKKLHLIAVLSGTLLALCGCSTAYNVEVYMSPKVKEKYQIRPSLEVDIAGVNNARGEHFKEISVDDYFTPGNALRDGSEHATLHFSEETGAPKRLDSDDAIWKKFAALDMDTLYLLVNLPAQPGKEKMKTDARKISIPVSGHIFTRTRYFEITPSGLVQLKSRPDYSAEKIQIENTEMK